MYALRKTNEAVDILCLAVLGDYNEQEHTPGYVSEYRLLLKQTPKHEEKIAEAHRKYRLDLTNLLSGAHFA